MLILGKQEVTFRMGDRGLKQPLLEACVITVFIVSHPGWGPSLEKAPPGRWLGHLCLPQIGSLSHSGSVPGSVVPAQNSCPWWWPLGWGCGPRLTSSGLRISRVTQMFTLSSASGQVSGFRPLNLLGFLSGTVDFRNYRGGSPSAFVLRIYSGRWKPDVNGPGASMPLTNLEKQIILKGGPFCACRLEKVVAIVQPAGLCGVRTLPVAFLPWMRLKPGESRLTQTLPATHLWYLPKRENAVLANLELSEFCHLFSFLWRNKN